MPRIVYSAFWITIPESKWHKHNQCVQLTVLKGVLVIVVYLDYQSTTPTDPKVVDAMLPFLTEHFGNPHSNEHAVGWHAAQSVENARHQVAELIKADENEIIFTSGATESNNLAILGTLKKSRCDHLVVSEIEHKSSLECAKFLANEGVSVSFLPVDQYGKISMSALMASLQGKRALVSIIGVNNEIGTIQDLRKIAQATHDHGGLLHVDAAQMPAAQDIDVEDTAIDLLSLSSHKIYGPKGLGALYIRRDAQDFVAPIFHGGGQENGFRPGTLPTALIVGFGKAASIMQERSVHDRQHMKHLSNLLFSHLSSAISDVQMNGPSFNDRHPGNLNIRFPSINSKTLLEMLQPDIAASTGSACSSGTPEPSYVLRSIGLTYQEAEESLRLSIGRFTTEEEITSATHHISKRIQALNDLK